ncbi:MAG: DUF5706 domain-containing protein [Cyclobacteriaceae bacterium]|nr:DUF5706 domain-containing protein [Cyclobacteriaceae bacterium]
MTEETFFKEPKDKSSRERQTFYRVAFQNSANLLQIADNKANIIISINALVISSMIALVSYGSISSQIEVQNLKVLIPILLFLGVIISSTILAVQVARPKILGKPKTPGGKPTFSVLFFGSTEYYTLDEFVQETQRLLHHKNDIMDQMSISLYYQGKILSRKYALLNKAYMVFILGMAFGILVFFWILYL